MSQERDTHFQNFAEMLYPELARGCYLLYTYRETGNHDAADQVIHQIKEHIAQRAFDFADYAIRHVHGSDLDAIKHYGLAGYFEEFPEGRERVPDMEKWPE